MTTEALYYQTLLRLNRLGTGVGQRIPVEVWVTLFNATQTIWLQKTLPLRNDSVYRDQLAPLLTEDLKLFPYRQDERAFRFELPPDLYQLTGQQVRARQHTCSKWLTGRSRSSEWIHANWENPLQQPDFTWEETLSGQAANPKGGMDLLVYYRDFTVDHTLISYYRAPTPIDLPGYQRLDGKPSRLVNSELGPECLQEILNLSLPLFT